MYKRQEHVLTVVIPVTGGLIQVHGADAGSHNVQDVYKRQPLPGVPVTALRGARFPAGERAIRVEPWNADI